MPNGLAAAKALLGNPEVQALVKQAAHTAAQKVSNQLSGPRRPNTNAAARRRNTRNQRALARGAALRSIPRGPTQPKDVRYRAGATTNQHFAPRGQGYYDAFATTPDAAILSSAVGPCTPIEGYARFIVSGSVGVSGLPYDVVTGDSTLTTNITTNAKLIIFNVGSSDDQLGATYEVINSGGKAVIHSEPITAAAFSELGPTIGMYGSHSHFPEEHNQGGSVKDGDPAQRVESIPLRGSVRIRNITERYSVGGEVRMMRYNGGLFLGHDPSPGNVAPVSLQETMGVNEFLDICDMMRDTKRATTFGADDLLTAHQMNTYPSDSIRSHTFKEDTSFLEACMTPKFCTLVILIDDFKSGTALVNNTYSLNFVAHRAARFRPGSLLFHKSRVLGTNPSQHHQKHQQEANSSVANVVKSGVAAASGLAAYTGAMSSMGNLGKMGMLGDVIPLLL